VITIPGAETPDDLSTVRELIQASVLKRIGSTRLQEAECEIAAR
jgi:hypothetical protein